MNRWRWAALLLSVGLAAARTGYLAWGPLGLAPDEAYYWVWAEHPALSYHSKGPMVAWIITATTRLAGDTEVGVRLGSVILAAATGLLLYLLTWRVYLSDRAALLSLALANAIPVYAAGAVIMTPDTPLVLFWTLAMFGKNIITR